MDTDKVLEWGKWLLMIFVVFLVFKMLKKFGMFGETEGEKKDKENEQKADALADSQALNNAVSSDVEVLTPLVKHLIKKGIIKKGEKITVNHLKKIMPNYNSIPSLVQKMHKAKGFWNDKEMEIFSVFRQMSSKYESAFLTTIFKSFYKEDLYSYLDDTLDSEEMAKIFDIVAKKPNF